MDGAPGPQAGGIAGLVEFLRLHGAAVEADLARFYPGTRLSDLTTGRLTWRRLRVLLDGLPLSCEVNRKLHGDVADWSVSDYLAALQVDALQVANWQRSRDGSTGKNRPKPLKRPTDTASIAAGRTPAEVRAYLARYRPEEVPDGL